MLTINKTQIHGPASQYEPAHFEPFGQNFIILSRRIPCFFKQQVGNQGTGCHAYSHKPDRQKQWDRSSPTALRKEQIPAGTYCLISLSAILPDSALRHRRTRRFSPGACRRRCKVEDNLSRQSALMRLRRCR